ncbi:hypothetical protein AB0C52_33310 [Streptomyces sp. NPDC048717]|uniref:hypothetical protein n=1 Tax=Streptomyces sp. NPDC048717 TaxID=3154928 RepID=UPI003437DE1D
MTDTPTIHGTTAPQAILPLRTVWLVTGLRPAAALTASALADAGLDHAALIIATALYFVLAALMWASPVRRLTTMPTPVPTLAKDAAHVS